MLPYIFTLGATANPDEVNANFAYLESAISSAVTAGVIVGFANASAPSGWLLCDGSQVAKATYPDLYAVIGTSYGAETSTHFTLPDSRGRTLVGAGQGASLTDRVVGAIFGAETHALTEAEMPSHFHSVDPPATASGGHSVDHAHQQLAGSSGSGTNTVAVINRSVNFGINNTGGATANHSHTTDIGAFNSGSKGSSSAHNNMQPSFVASYIIKY